MPCTDYLCALSPYILDFVVLGGIGVFAFWVFWNRVVGEM